MIYDELKNIDIYKGMNKNLDIAIDFIKEKKYLKNNFGKNVIDGEKIFFNCPEKPTTKINIGQELEYHKRYIDIHVVFEGEEIVNCSSVDDCIETKSYDEENDYGLFKSDIKKQTSLILNTKNFLILFPSEPHIALLAVDEPKEIKKVIFKVEF
jgi:YhcH/YjgK/YiaL family protein